MTLKLAFSPSIQPEQDPLTGGITVPANGNRLMVFPEQAGLPLDKDEQIRFLKAELATERKRRIAAEKMAMTDYLTGLHNTASLMMTLNERRMQTGDFLLMIDLDGFKATNDTFGHNAGDEALRVVAQFLTSKVRETDMVVRKGGDEFVIVLFGADESAARSKIEDISRGFEDLAFEWNGRKIGIRASLGKCAIEAGQSPSGILAAADSHMYKIKKSKGDTRLKPALVFA
jgi:diguanylate cyclase (GGDEF)-like protein